MKVLCTLMFEVLTIGPIFGSKFELWESYISSFSPVDLWEKDKHYGNNLHALTIQIIFVSELPKFEMACPHGLQGR